MLSLLQESNLLGWRVLYCLGTDFSELLHKDVAISHFSCYHCTQRSHAHDRFYPPAHIFPMAWVLLQGNKG